MTQDEIVRTLLGVRPALCAGYWLVLRDAHLAEDVFQEVLVKALAMDKPFASEVHLLAWSRTVGRNVALNMRLRQGRELLNLREETWRELEQLLSEARPTLTARHHAMLDCLEALPEKSRSLLQLRYGDGLSGDEIGRALRMHSAAVFQALSRLHRSLRGCVELRLKEGRA